MRKIKFRVWDQFNNEMCYDPKTWFLITLGGDVVDGEGLGYDEFYPLLQYTGLKDKNGKEIYEGDILKMLNGSTYEVKFYVEDNELDCSGYMFSSFGVEVIGNIYENPELLN